METVQKVADRYGYAEDIMDMRDKLGRAIDVGRTVRTREGETLSPPQIGELYRQLCVKALTAPARPVRQRCPHYTADQGCPLHGETCR